MKVTIQLPPNLWSIIKDRCSNKGIIIDIKLKDGTKREKYFINNKGIIEGKVVGGHSGIDPTFIDFKPEDILAIREEAGVLGFFGLKKWKAC